MCFLEKEMLLLFFDPKSHLPTHLIEELFYTDLFMQGGCIPSNVTSQV